MKRPTVRAWSASAIVVLVACVLLRLCYPGLTHRIIHEDIGMRTRHLFRAATILVAAHAVGAHAGATGSSQAAAIEAGPVPATAIGINPSSVRAGYFANLAIGHDWAAIATHWALLPSSNQTADGGISSIPAGAVAALMLTLPDTGPEGTTIGCTWVGHGAMIARGTANGLVTSGNSLRFHMTNTKDVHAMVYLQVNSVDPQDPIHHIDCREAGVPATAVFNPAFVNSLRGFKTIRFMDWQRANANVKVTWETRNRPNGIDFTSVDGVPVELELALANELGTDPWFCMPWNADTGYIEHFAQYVHDHLPAGRRVYVETSNEVWNIGFAVSKQATAEGLAEGLSPNPGLANLYRYAEKTSEVMKIWTRVFADHPNRLVRIAATQQWAPAKADAVLGFRDTASHVDALATSSYFGGELMHTVPTTDNLDELYKRLNDELDSALALVVANKAVARKYGKSYAAYEGGQGLFIPWNIPLLEKIERDPRMYDLYMKFISHWCHQVGGPLTFYNSVDSIRTGGAWGLLEYSGQPLADAPKMRAVAGELSK